MDKARITSGCSGQMSTFAADPSVSAIKTNNNIIIILVYILLSTNIYSELLHFTQAKKIKNTNNIDAAPIVYIKTNGNYIKLYKDTIYFNNRTIMPNNIKAERYQIFNAEYCLYDNKHYLQATIGNIDRFSVCVYVFNKNTDMIGYFYIGTFENDIHVINNNYYIISKSKLDNILRISKVNSNYKMEWINESENSQPDEIIVSNNIVYINYENIFGKMKTRIKYNDKDGKISR